jgi:hypothetical protein
LAYRFSPPPLLRPVPAPLTPFLQTTFLFLRAKGAAMQTQPGMSLFMPAWNEAENLPLVVGQAISYLDRLGEPFQVIVVDDGSSDSTPTVLESLKEANPSCFSYVRHKQNQGYGSALRTGFRACLDTEHAWIGFCDSDGQFLPSDVGKLKAAAVATGSDIAVGYRIHRADRLTRRLMGKTWSTLSSYMLGADLIDVDCGLKVFNRNALLHLEPTLSCDYAAISPEIMARAHLAGHKVIQVGVEHYPRQHGESSGADLHVVWESVKGLVHMRQAIKKPVS